MIPVAWILAQSPNITVLSGSMTPEELTENVKAMSIDLSADDAAWMREYAEKIG